MLGGKWQFKKKEEKKGWRHPNVCLFFVVVVIFLWCTVILKDSCWFHCCNRRVLMRALQSPLPVTSLNQVTRVQAAHFCKHPSACEQNTALQALLCFGDSDLWPYWVRWQYKKKNSFIHKEQALHFIVKNNHFN